MMDKKRSIGVTIFALLVLFPLPIIVLQSYWELFDGSFDLYGMMRHFLKYWLHTYIFGLFLVFLSMGIFKLRNWARLICLFGSILFLVWGWICTLTGWNPLQVMGLGELVYIIYPNIIGIPTIIFLTRPKIKEQFK